MYIVVVIDLEEIKKGKGMSNEERRNGAFYPCTHSNTHENIL